MTPTHAIAEAMPSFTPRRIHKRLVHVFLAKQRAAIGSSEGPALLIAHYFGYLSCGAELGALAGTGEQGPVLISAKL